MADPPFLNKAGPNQLLQGCCEFHSRDANQSRFFL
jgi:hypothetical protein